MNENIDLTKILKDCPKGTKLYSSIYGELIYSYTYTNPSAAKFVFILPNNNSMFDNTPIKIEYYWNGKYIFNMGECTLFPSKDQRDWNKFSAPWYKKSIEPKFNVGQYITDGYVVGQITSIEDEYHCYKILDFMGGVSTTIPFTLQNNYHLWTIQDAKDGDVLCCKSGWMCISKNLNNHTNTFSSYCFMDSDKCFFDIGFDAHTLDKKFINAYNGEIYPATKEQRDLFFQKMKEAGYKWNADTKTLEKSVKHKFDPKTLNVFDKVLVKISNETFNKWYADFVAEPSHVKSETPLILGAKEANMVIPYNDETKHLIGTTEEAPEYYRYWED